MSDRRRAELGMGHAGQGIRGEGGAAGVSGGGERFGGRQSDEGKLFPPVRLNTALGHGRSGGDGGDGGDGADEVKKKTVVEDDHKGYLGGWLPVKRITDEEVQARRELDRESKMK